MNSEQRTPEFGDHGGNSWVERLACFNRLHAEVNLNCHALEDYFTRTRDTSDKRLDAIEARIASLVGPDRDDISELDDDMLQEYVKLRGEERELKTVNLVAREVLDRLATCTTPEDKDEETNDNRQPATKS